MTASDSLWELMKDRVPMQVFSVKILEVDKSNHVCKVEPTDGRPVIYGVRLCAIEDAIDNKIVIYPKVESLGLVSLIENRKTEAFLLAVSEVESFELKAEGNIVFNGGDLGGLVKVESLVSRLNAIEDRVNLIQTNYNAHTHPSNGSPTTSVISEPNLQKTQISDIENEKIKQ
ncbi:MAG: hypothetical protein NW226_17490 [Microscillaceae bacterium]|nr:hypothetical protein [Microscillaceae bacterium]